MRDELPKVGTKLSSEEAMTLAISVARKGEGWVAPNPMVGCVILDRKGGFLSAGYHAKYGEKHAEVDAVDKVADKSHLEGAQVFVTLEPCAHHGKTPPCAEFLARLSIASVFYAVADPNPQAGGGAAVLKKNGKAVTHFKSFQAECEQLAEVFLTNIREGRPFVALKVASSLDGKTALAHGESKWITKEELRLAGRRLRGVYDAILVGVNTFLRDDPALDIRHAEFEGRENKVILLDPTGRAKDCFEKSQLVKVHKPENIYWVTRSRSDLNSEINKIELSEGEINLHVLLKSLYTRGIFSILIEGGPLTNEKFISQGAIDRLHCFMDFSILGKGMGWTGDWDIPTLDKRVEITNVNVKKLGSGIYVTGKLGSLFD